MLQHHRSRNLTLLEACFWTSYPTEQRLNSGASTTPPACGLIWSAYFGIQIQHQVCIALSPSGDGVSPFDTNQRHFNARVNHLPTSSFPLIVTCGSHLLHSSFK
jgi:hypothetical protein